MAPIGGLAGCELNGVNVPSREVPILSVRGCKDNVVNFGNTAISQRDAPLAF